ncbi:MAG: hypothetical protein Q9214_003906, partial [Letrouitia sp. 1 TL-2023]
MQVAERDLLREKAAKYCGAVKIWLHNLRPEEEPTKPRQADLKNIARLTRIFQLDGCFRCQPQNRVPVLIQNGARRANVSDEPEDLAFISLEQGEQLVYLHGYHRLQAAKEFFPPSDAWWVADLYSADLSDENKRTIREEYLGASNFCDGDIFRHFRRCVLAGNGEDRKWLARWSESKRRDVLQLDKAAVKDRQMRELRDGLDSLLPFPALWPALQVGTFHRLLTLRCPEELARYLRHIKDTWQFICANDKALGHRIDVRTVKSLEGRCLRFCTEDASLVEGLISRREIFPTVASHSIRANILGRLREIKHVIPTIHTFLEDTKYLEPCAQIMKSILPQGFRG